MSNAQDIAQQKTVAKVSAPRPASEGRRAAKAALDTMGAAAPPASTAWGAAWAAYAEAKAAYEVASTAQDAAMRSVAAQMPDELVDPARRDHRIGRWVNAQMLRENTKVSAQDKARLLPVQSAWDERERQLERELDSEGLNDRAEAAYDVLSEREAELMAIPAPDVGAVLTKMRLLSIFLDDDKEGYDSPAYCLAQLDRRLWSEKMPVHIFRDVARLSGQRHPILTMADWSPRNWVERFEESGGYATISDEGQALSLEMPGGVPGLRPSAVDLMAELYKEPHYHAAVWRFVEQRREDGGDPRRDSYGRPREAC